MKSLSTLRGVLRRLRGDAGDSQDAMADSSTTAWPIPDLKVQSCWARRQLHAGIRYVPVASILMRSLSTLRGVLGRLRGDAGDSQDSMADSSTTA